MSFWHTGITFDDWFRLTVNHRDVWSSLLPGDFLPCRHQFRFHKRIAVCTIFLWPIHRYNIWGKKNQFFFWKIFLHPRVSNLDARITRNKPFFFFCLTSIPERCHQDFCCKTTDILAKGSTVIPTSPQISVYVKFHILKTQWSCSAKKGGSEFSQLMPPKRSWKITKRSLKSPGKVLEFCNPRSVGTMCLDVITLPSVWEKSFNTSISTFVMSS